MNEILINTDGGSRGNPGPSGVGIVFFGSDGKELYRYCEYIGEGTNNEAEYKAILKALRILINSKWFGENNGTKSKVTCRLDSKLVVEQLNGNFKAKQENIQKLLREVKGVLANFHLSINFVHVPREENKIADQLVNKALDEAIKNNGKKI